MQVVRGIVVCHLCLNCVRNVNLTERSARHEAYSDMRTVPGNSACDLQQPSCAVHIGTERQGTSMLCNNIKTPDAKH
jgi:hypothetical protein